jgi:hypothetical protein
MAAAAAAADSEDEGSVVAPLGPPELRVFRAALTGAEICRLAISLSAAQSRVQVAALLGVDPHALCFVGRQRPLTDRAFASTESCVVVVLSSYAVGCFRCGARVRCSCSRLVVDCLCPRSAHSCRDEDHCEACW